jgi:plasmid stabilization system protein ParE
MANVSFLPAADRDYEEARDWYQARSAQAAAGLEAAMEVALQRIAESPELYPLCDDRHRFYVLRRYPYSVVYRVESGNVLVVAVAHNRRSPSFWKDRA